MKNKSKFLFLAPLMLACIIPFGALSTVEARATDTLPEYDAENYPVSNNEEIKFDFEDDTYDVEEDFYRRNGNWIVEDGCLKQTRDFANWNDYQLNYNKKVFGDFTIKTRFSIQAITGTIDGWFGVFCRRTNLWHQHEESGYIFSTRGNNSTEFKGKVTFVNWVKSVEYNDYADYIEDPGFIDAVFVAKGNTFYAYYGDQIKTGDFAYKVTDLDFPEAGFIGIGAGNVRCEIEYFEIYTGDKQKGIVPDLEPESSKVDHLDLSSITIPSNKTLYTIAIIIGSVSFLFGIVTLFVGGKKHE